MSLYVADITPLLPGVYRSVVFKLHVDICDVDLVVSGTD
jgi:hypothetical protein